jgi:hypothetical protein
MMLAMTNEFDLQPHLKGELIDFHKRLAQISATGTIRFYRTQKDKLR